jgi:hypothetical protein
MYKNRVSEGKIVPVSTWDFSLFWRVISQREASFGSLFVTVYQTLLPRGSLVIDIPAGDGKLVNLFLLCSHAINTYSGLRL